MIQIFYAFSVSYLEAIQKFFGHPKFKHFLILLKFFTFSVALLTADIITDILSALDFFQRGHVYWGLFTMLPIIAPFIVQCIITLLNLPRCFKIVGKCLELDEARFSIWQNDVWKLLWHFPLFQPIRSDLIPLITLHYTQLIRRDVSICPMSLQKILSFSQNILIKIVLSHNYS